MKLEKITRYTLYVGLNDKDEKIQLVPAELAEEIVMEIVGDCSIERIRGCYSHEDGTRVFENTLKVSILFRSEAEIEQYVAAIKRRLNQESIAVCREITESALA